jgi:hypothetical protein
MPFKRMSLAPIKGARDLSMRMEVPTFILYERPIGRHSSRKKRHSRIGSLLWNWSNLFSLGGVHVGAIFEGGGTREEIQEQISFCLSEFVATPLWPSVGVKPNTSKVGDLESSGTLECLGFDSKAQNTSH